MKAKKCWILAVVLLTSVLTLCLAGRAIPKTPQLEKDDKTDTPSQPSKWFQDMPQWLFSGNELSETEVRDLLLIYSKGTFEQRNSLKGLDSVEVRVRVVGAEPSGYGLREEAEALQTAIELRLRQHGIKVGPDGPSLHIIVDGAYNSEFGWAAIAVRVELEQSAVLLFRPKTNALVVTWQQTDVIVAKFDKFRGVKENVMDCVDEFINDYLAANPTKGRPVSPPSTKIPPVSPPVTKTPLKGRISAIILGEDSSSAFIDDRIVHEGDTIGSVTVVKIYRDRVVFEKKGTAETIRWTQIIGEAPKAHWE